MSIETVYLGGWFQRTTLHLSELWEFFDAQTSALDLDPDDLLDAYEALRIVSAERVYGQLEYIKLQTSDDILVRIYEDGLIVLKKQSTDIENDAVSVKEYYEQEFSRAISLLFSRGAPVPKELAHIMTVLPFIFTAKKMLKRSALKVFKDLDDHPHSVLTSGNISVYRGNAIFLITGTVTDEVMETIVESQIFFREFKAQLHRYVGIHRELWEKIKAIKERGKIAGTEVDGLRNELSGYQKTINLIEARIDQMPVYVRARQKVTDISVVDTYLHPLFQFKFDTLIDTHEYVKHLWKMTKNYLQSAMDMMGDLQSKSTKNTISSLQLVTTIGVVASLVGYIGKDTLPPVTTIGIVYFVGLLSITWGANYVVSYFYKHKKYKVESSDDGIEKLKNK